jgi:hypothetical protein
MAEVKAKDAFPSPHCYSIVLYSSLLCAGQRKAFVERRYFKLLSLIKHLTTNNTLNRGELVTAKMIYGATLILVASFCDLYTAGY